MTRTAWLGVLVVPALHVLLCLSNEDGLKIEVISKPKQCAKRSKKFDQVRIHYVAIRTSDGGQVDSSRDRDLPLEFQTGVGQVIKGLDHGLMDMCIGEKRIITIPPELAYGEDSPKASIPPNTTLRYDVEMLSFREKSPPPNVFKEMDTDGDNKLTPHEISEYMMEQQKIHNIQLDDNKHKQVVSRVFEHDDLDKDGYISHDEFSGPKHDEL